MINTKETLKKLHAKFPLLSLDDLFAILDCYVEERCLWNKDITWSSEPKPETLVKTSPYTTNITCNEDISTSKIVAVRDCMDSVLKAN